MRRVAEIIYIVEPERETFLNNAINLSEEEKRVLWMCGVRKQQYFALNDLIFMTFEYVGNDFLNDMEKMANYLDTKNVLVKKRRKNVPIEERATTNWWAPVKRIGSLLETEPKAEENSWELECLGMISNDAEQLGSYSDISYDEGDWIDEIHI